MSKNEKAKVDVTSAEFEQKHDKDAHRLYIGVIVFLIAVFVGGFIYGISSVLALEGQFDMGESAVSDIPAPETKEQAYNLVIEAMQESIDKSPKLKADHAFQINTETINTGFGSELADTFNFVKDGLNDTIKNDFDFYETGFFEDISKKLKIPNISLEDIDDFQCNYISYRCRMCGQESIEPLENCSSCGCDLPYKMTLKDDYEIVLILKDTPQVLQNNFSVRTVDEVMNLLKGKYENTLNIKSLDFGYDALRIKLLINRFDKKVKYVEYSKDIDVKTNIEFLNEFSSLKSSNFDFKALEITAYTLTWPGITLNASEKSVEPKDRNNNIQARLTCDDTNKQNIKWKSSDESIIKVDDEGYLKSGKKIGDATVTASFEYGGNVYSAECVVHVRHIVSGVKLKVRNKTLNVGDTFRLEAKISPKNATVQTVKWYSTDESVLKVDENGVVTALSTGKAKAFAVTDDGAYRSSCEVTVK